MPAKPDDSRLPELLTHVSVVKSVQVHGIADGIRKDRTVIRMRDQLLEVCQPGCQLRDYGNGRLGFLRLWLANPPAPNTPFYLDRSHLVVTRGRRVVFPIGTLQLT